MTNVNGRLLFLLNENVGVLFFRMSFYLVDLFTGRRTLICEMPVGKKTILASRSRILSRLKRLEPKCIGRLSKSEFIFSLFHGVWLIDVEKKTCKKLCDNPIGFSDVINFCSTESGVYWGDYGQNRGYHPVRVYCLDKKHNLRIVYSYPAGSIRHIHNIVKDSDSILIFAGDNESQAGIYRANHDWSIVSPWKIGKQRYRAVVGFPLRGGLLYATDSVETENHLWYIESDGTEHELTTINGSCIYGSETKDYFLFSTTVESHEGGGVLRLLSNELGGGIKSKDVHIIAVNKNDLSVRIVKKYRKDIWPMKLFQYGRAQFAGGQAESTDGVWCYPIACKRIKGRSEYIKL